MIRINLIAGQRRAAKAPGKTFQIGQKVTVAGSLLLVITALGIGWRFWANRQAEAQMTADIAAARREETRLAEVLKQVSDFEAQRAILQKRVALIDELRKGQNAPVHMIDQISRSLPEMTWLTSVRQDAYNVTINGRCTTLTALSDFVANLEATRYFKRPVEIVSSTAVGDKDGPDLIEFTIKGTFQMAGIDPPAPDPLRWNLRLLGDDAGGKLLGRHFQREEADDRAVECILRISVRPVTLGYMIGNVGGERGLSHRWTPGDDDQVRGLQAAHPVV